MNPQKQNSITELPGLDTYRFENLFNVYRDGNFFYYNLLATTNFPNTINSEFYYSYTVPYDNLTWTFISELHYQTTELWWLICSVNNIQNPIDFPKAGTVLKMLKADVVMGVLQSIKQN